jgi:hypothetical protein
MLPGGGEAATAGRNRQHAAPILFTICNHFEPALKARRISGFAVQALDLPRRDRCRLTSDSSTFFETQINPPASMLV